MQMCGVSNSSFSSKATRACTANKYHEHGSLLSDHSTLLALRFAPSEDDEEDLFFRLFDLDLFFLDALADRERDRDPNICFLRSALSPLKGPFPPPMLGAGTPPPSPGPFGAAATGVALGSASRTVLPQMSAPCIRCMAFSTSRALANSTKPKPLERPVSLSMTIRALITSPHLENSVLSCSSVHVRAIPPTKILALASEDEGRGAPMAPAGRGAPFNSTVICRPCSSMLCNRRTALWA
mmetsp:Transcript_45449/g.120047  ORF Transcript_45449/g.120047 Transcript_45449/m.120047 type:complete len:239 (+) Transcript_45449:2-718(+)